MRFAIRHETIGPVGALQRLRIAHLSDLHLWFGCRLLDEVDAALAACRPDVLALTGDYADTPWGPRDRSPGRVDRELARRSVSFHLLGANE